MVYLYIADRRFFIEKMLTDSNPASYHGYAVGRLNHFILTFCPFHEYRREKHNFIWLEINHHANMFMQCRPPYIPLLFSKTGVYRGIHYVLIFALKHRLWVLVTTAVLARTHNVLSKNKKNIKKNYLKIIVFTAVKYCNKLHRHICAM